MKTVLIIGAGMSGVAAGRTLQDAGFQVKILEGRERIGGRTWTDSSLGPDIDFGGAWIHGPHGNPLTALAKRFGLTWKWTDFKNLLGQSTLPFDSDGRPIDVAAYTEGIHAYDGAVAYAYSSLLTDNRTDPSLSVADVYAEGLPLPALSHDAQLGYKYASEVRATWENAAGLDEIGWFVEKYVKLPGGDNLACGGGFRTLVTGLAEGLEIAYETVVEGITYRPDGVTLATNRGEMTADLCVVTVPLGVLKSDLITFDPPLPAEKRGAIERIGFGNYEKIALKFPHIFWPKEPHRLNYISDATPPLFSAWLNYAHYANEPVLVAYHGGPSAVATNEMDDEELITGCMETLRKMFGPDIPDPLTYKRTGWSTDPFSQGSYSFTKVGQRPEDRQRVAAPLSDTLYFAGEATHPTFSGTVHGAYETGIRAAQEIMGKRLQDESVSPRKGVYRPSS